ncbi:transcription factor 20 [Trichomycterus rosablanca]|uniref:transcription factor 20 n=1 Tax=Trichomycterus rosablanca TaxID=2290929 RepID=UPI002F35A55F
MEEPPDNSDGVQPQEPTPTCSLPRVFDLTKNGEECLLKTNPIEALHLVQPPGWYLSSGTSNGMVLPENELDPSLQPGDQIQPDNALSNTTVTLSYVTRSHLFNGGDSLAQHPQIYSIPLSKAFTLHPAVYDAAQLVGDAAGPSLCVDVDQPCLQPLSVPVGLAACGNPFDFVSPAQVVENVASLCYLQQAHDVAGIRNAESLALETLRSLQQSDPAECKIPVNLGEIQNGAIGGLWNAGSFDGIENALEQHKNITPELVLLISRTQEPVILPSDQGPTGLAVSLNQELISALDHHRFSPVALVNRLKEDSGDSVAPQTAGSPSPEDSFVEETDNTTLDEVSNGGSNMLTSANKIANVSFARNVNNDELGQSEGLAEAQEAKTERCKSTSRLPARRELPPRSTRGMRLEAIVQNMYPTRFRSAHVSSSKKSRPVSAQTDRTANRGPSQDASSARDEPGALENERHAKAARSQEKEDVTEVVESSQISTSCSEIVPKRSPGTLHESTARAKKSKKRRKASNESRASVENEAAPPQPKRSPKSTSNKHSPAVGVRGERSIVKTVKKVKTVPATKSKKKKQKVKGKPSVFSPQEPEIRLKYLTCKDGKKDKRDETFTPFVRVDLRAERTCTVVNYPEESARLSRGKQRAPVASGKVPASSFVQYGRASVDGARRATLVCCLCGGAANAMDLGDLHGPYYSEGFGPKDRPPSAAQESREDDSTDSDSLDASRPSRVARTRTPHSRPQAASLGVCQRLARELDLSSSPAAKRSRMDGVVDWYTPPVVPVHVSEYWLHEDCGVWSAGVFLVKGKLYGLENAVKAAKQTVCSCCSKTGASLGCFFKNCPNKYHYLCAVQSGCVLNEENFSMKCRKHKNKSIKAVSPHKPSDR